MSRKVYRGASVDVSFDPELCRHAQACVRGAPLVFDTTQRPWIKPDAARADEVVATVARCPSGALRIEADRRTA